MTLSQLHNEIKQRCQDYGLKCDVISSGMTSARMAIVSSYPGPAEHRTGIPFSGGSGKILWDCLRPCGLTRADFYMTNVIKAVQSYERDDQAPLRQSSPWELTPKTEFDLWREVLKYELSQLPNLEYILILGNEALRALTDHSGVTQWRGSIVDVSLANRLVRVLVSINPAVVSRAHRILSGEERGIVPMRSAQRILQFDCHKFKLLTQGRLSNYVITEHINPTYAQAADFIDHCLSTDGPVALDIETVNGETACVGLATDPHEGFCINLIEPDPQQPRGLHAHYTLDEEAALRRRLQHLVASPKVRLVEQNGIYDTCWLWFKDGIKTRAVWYDTLLAHHTLYPGLPHSLAFLTSRYTTHPYYKDEKEGWKQVGDADRFWRYNVKDCCITLAVQAATNRELEKAGLTAFFHDHVMRLQPHLARMIVGGIKCDLPYKAQVNAQLEAQLEAQREDFHRAVVRATGDPEYRPNPLSPIQVGELLFKRLKLVGRGVSTDERNRSRITAHHRTREEDREVLTILNDYKDRHKFCSTYVQSEIDPDGRMRCEYKQYGTQKAPGRLSSSKTPWGTGMNMQNQPHEAYPMFVCEPGYSLFYLDLEQAEARVVGWLAKIEKWIEDFERARLNPGTFDAHRSLAAEMWHIPYDQTPARDHDENGRHSLRYIAKRCRHGLNYRMAAQRLAETTGLSLREATDAYRRYHSINPELRGWWDALEAEVRRTGLLYNLYGRRWVLTEPVTDMTLESIVAFKPQSTVGDKINRCIYLAEEDDSWPKGQARVALNTHDGVVGIGRSDVVDTCLRILRRHAEEPVAVQGMPPLIIPAALKRTYKGTSWKIDSGKVTFYDDERGFHRWSDLAPLRSVA